MKLNKLTSAVSVSLLAVALTACGSDDDAPIIGATPAPTTTPTTPAPAVDNTAKIAEIKANAIAAGLTDANATAFANSAVNLTIGSDAYNAALREALANQAKANSADSNNVVSPVVVDRNFRIPGVDATKQATVTANHYARQEGSTFDRTANPEQYGGLGAVGTDDPTTQNPWLSNYVLAVETTTDSTGQKKVVAIDSTGEMAEKDPASTTDGGKKVDDVTSPYIKNGGLSFKTESNGGTRTYHYGGTATAANSPINQFHNDLEKANNGTSGLIKTIQEVNVNNVTASLQADATDAFTAAKNTTAATSNNGLAVAASATVGVTNNNDPTSGLIVYNARSIAVGGPGKEVGYKIPVYGSEENVYQLDKDGNLTVANALDKLTASNVAAATTSREIVPAATPTTAAHTTAYTEAQPAAALTNAVAVANNYETRVFGKNFRGLEAGATGSQTTANTYIGRYNSKNKIVSAGPTASTLHNVQYGRLTNNIDVLTDKKENDAEIITYRQFQEHGAPNTVDTYFYRGTNHTTLAQMDALKARGGSVQYYGHALTYGIGPKVSTNTTSNNLPTSYGLASNEATIGNFVQAKYDIAKSTVDGSIYNFVNPNVNVASKVNDFTRQDLVTFSGNVVGNTVIGTSTKLGATPETGSLTASFFGSNANEIGGQVSSIQRSQGYNTPKWGAVFGATRGTTIENFNVIEQGQ